MRQITANTKLVVYTLGRHIGENTAAFYQGLRETLVASFLTFINDTRKALEGKWSGDK